MSTHPVDIIANAIYEATDGLPMGDVVGAVETRSLANAAVNALDNPDIIRVAVEALLADGWRHTHEGPQGVGELSDDDLANIARTVLRSLAGE